MSTPADIRPHDLVLPLTETIELNYLIDAALRPAETRGTLSVEMMAPGRMKLSTRRGHTEEMSVNRQTKRALRVIDGGSFIACILLAIMAGVAIVVLGSPLYQQNPTSAVPLWKSLAEASVRALLIGGPMVLLFGLPVFYWLYRRVQPAALNIVLLGAAGVLPGIALLFVGLAAQNELMFIGLYLVVGGVWSAVFGGTLFYLLRGAPALPIALAALLIGAGVIGTLLST